MHTRVPTGNYVMFAVKEDPLIAVPGAALGQGPPDLPLLESLPTMSPFFPFTSS